jgi:hypothetical protein
MRHVYCWSNGACPTLFLEQITWRLGMKKNEFSEVASNLLIVGSVSLAFAPLLLGDKLLLIVSGLMKDGGVMITQLTNYVNWLVS